VKWSHLPSGSALPSSVPRGALNDRDVSISIWPGGATMTAAASSTVARGDTCWVVWSDGLFGCEVNLSAQLSPSSCFQRCFSFRRRCCCSSRCFSEVTWQRTKCQQIKNKFYLKISLVFSAWLDILNKPSQSIILEHFHQLQCIGTHYMSYINYCSQN